MVFFKHTLADVLLRKWVNNMRYSLIGEVAELVIYWQEAKYHISMDWTLAGEYALDWYENTDITNKYELAACVLHFGKYEPFVDYEFIQILANDYFKVRF